LSLDQELPASGAVARSTTDWRLTLTYLFAAITLLAWFGGRILKFIWPETSDWLTVIGALGTIIAMLWLIICAFLPKPRSAPILLATLMIIQAARMIEAQSVGGLVGLGFRIHASPIEQYLAKCQMFEFDELDAKHAIGSCEYRTYPEGGLPPGQALPTVMYDPTGNFLKPEAQRSPEWKRAFNEAKEYGGAMKFRGTDRLFGDFYLVDLYY
jgi:hypothetical protein